MKQILIMFTVLAFTTAGISAKKTITVDSLIQKIKVAQPKARKILMTQLKERLKKMSKVRREATIRKMTKSIGKTKVAKSKTKKNQFSGHNPIFMMLSGRDEYGRSGHGGGGGHDGGGGGH